ncbi:RHS repeat domain-containing protein [Kineobactrum salinum]|uniref:RHS repeat-associated core domain-containing protein n=1 Tax=Kineobactrum salinum TaxID=2708301 RepID=A0A6C0TZG6_9GAMM|nr:RHS repeat-associated core domain-containing protein [Kineobactrum salinum]QIB64759.1 RHS repeat-associated core domain-containing protein [Kineobactrum salinum]
MTALTELAANPVVERYSYDAWGLRRNPETWEQAAITSLEKRGYTGHEHLDDVGMIHMNGRVYSPSLGRMLSPDPVTQAPENAQNYNRYSYAFNNPLTYTDPSGFRSDDRKTVCVDGCYQSGAGLEEVVVTGQRQSNSGVQGNLAALSFAGNGGGGSIISPGSAPGDNRAHNGNPMAEDEGDKDEELKPGECNETTCRAWLNKSNGFGVLSNLVNANGLFSSAALLNFISSDGRQWKGKNSKWNSMSWGGNQWTGARSEFLRRAAKIKAAGQGFFVLGKSLSLYEGVKAFSNGDSFGVLQSAINIGWGL